MKILSLLSLGLILCLVADRSFDRVAAAQGKALPVKRISQIDLKHGESQVKRMLLDRPSMAAVVREGDLVWRWTVRQFAGEGTGSTIFWNSNPPGLPWPFIASHELPTDQCSGALRLQKLDDKGKPITGEILWESAVFELYNMRNDPQFDAILKHAKGAGMTEREWIKENTELEYSALKNTASFYRLVWLPNAKSNNFRSNERCWPVAPDTYEAWISQYKDQSGYPFASWGREYRDSFQKNPARSLP